MNHLQRSRLFPLHQGSTLALINVLLTEDGEAAAALEKRKKNNQQFPISPDFKESQIEHQEGKRLGTHVEMEPSSSNYALGHYSLLPSEKEISPIPHIYYMIFISEETYFCNAVIPSTDITLVTATQATNEGFPREQAKHCRWI